MQTTILKKTQEDHVSILKKTRSPRLLGRHKIQYAASNNRDQIESFLRGETIEYVKCSEKVADAIDADVMKNEEGEVLTDLGSGLRLIQSYLTVDVVTGGLLTCNGLCYCAEHRREVCAACATDHRITNRLAELDSSIPHEKAFEIAMKLVDQEVQENTLARMAPEAGEITKEVKLQAEYDKRSFFRVTLIPRRCQFGSTALIKVIPPSHHSTPHQA